MRYFSEAIRLKPDAVEGHAALGSLLGRMGKNREAIIHFREVLRLDPKNVEAARNINIAAERLGAAR